VSIRKVFLMISHLHVFMQLDLLGNTAIVALVAGFVLLLMGVYPSKLRENSLNLVKHGILSTVATAVALVFVFAAMIPVFSKIVGATSLGSFFQFPVMWFHAVLGLLTIGSAVVMIVIWVKAPIGELGCAKTWRLMKPTLAFWGATVVLGVFIYLYGLR
jgi:hypothetical protein